VLIVDATEAEVLYGALDAEVRVASPGLEPGLS
jgi:hypothetical protein